FQHALLRALARLRHHRALLLLRDELHREIGEVAHDRLDVASDVAHLRELRGLDLEERRLREAGEAARDLRLPHALRPDHDDVLRRDLVAQLAGHALAAPAVAQRDRHGPLRVALPHHVAVELRHDLARREGGRLAHGSVTTWMWSFLWRQFSAGG